MKLLRFRRYRDYVEAQKNTLKKRGMGPYYTDVEIDKICEWMKSRGINPTHAVCHGARNGRETDDFVERFPGLNAFGTDLFPHSGRSANYKPKTEVVKCDFMSTRKEWIGKFDFIYSNSLDHAKDPIHTLNVWMNQLKGNGILFLQHIVNPGSYALGGDCFAANIDEILDLVNSVWHVEDLIYVNTRHDRESLRRRRVCHAIVIVVPKDPIGCKK